MQARAWDTGAAAHCPSAKRAWLGVPWELRRLRVIGGPPLSLRLSPPLADNLFVKHRLPAESLCIPAAPAARPALDQLTAKLPTGAPSPLLQAAPPCCSTCLWTGRNLLHRPARRSSRQSDKKAEEMGAEEAMLPMSPM